MSHDALLAQVESALAQITPMAEAGWDPAVSMERQLKWCRANLRNEPTEERPGPFSMGLMATREFDMYGDNPDLASLINEIQRAMNRRLGLPEY
jgi:hypothetical protein